MGPFPRLLQEFWVQHNINDKTILALLFRRSNLDPTNGQIQIKNDFLLSLCTSLDSNRKVIFSQNSTTCCLFRPAFGCWAHSQVVQHTFLSIFTVFFFVHSRFSIRSHSSHLLCYKFVQDFRVTCLFTGQFNT